MATPNFDHFTQEHPSIWAYLGNMIVHGDHMPRTLVVWGPPCSGKKILRDLFLEICPQCRDSTDMSRFSDWMFQNKQGGKDSYRELEQGEDTPREDAQIHGAHQFPIVATVQTIKQIQDIMMFLSNKPVILPRMARRRIMFESWTSPAVIFLENAAILPVFQSDPRFEVCRLPRLSAPNKKVWGELEKEMHIIAKKALKYLKN